MDNLEDSENTAKVSDSAYSTSCSNSQSRRSHSSKSTHSGSNSSGSSGYGGGDGKTSEYSSNNKPPPEKRVLDKEFQKKKTQPAPAECLEPEVEDCGLPDPSPVESPQEALISVIDVPSPVVLTEKGTESMDMASPATNVDESEHRNRMSKGRTFHRDGFSCIISMRDGVVMYTTSNLTSTLGFPKDLWIGRSLIDFVHPRDRDTLASQISNGLAVPKNVNGTQQTVPSGIQESTMMCRIRRYRGLVVGFGVKDSVVSFMPFQLKLSFKNVTDEEGNAVYLVIQATPFFSAYKLPNEVVTKIPPFVIRHAANGHIEYIDPESVPYLGYLPQDIGEKNALQLYHPDDLVYLRQVYETIVKEGRMAKSKPYRMMTSNGDYLKLETEWSSFINPWSKKLEFVIGKHRILEGPHNPDVFQTPESDNVLKLSEEEKTKAQALRDSILRLLNDVPTKHAEVAKQQMSKRCRELASYMESLIEETPKTEEELRLEIHEPDNSNYERDSVMLGGISPHHDYNDSKSSSEKSLSYTQLNYNETLQRYFDSHVPYCLYKGVALPEGIDDSKAGPSCCLSPMGNDSGDMGSSCDMMVVTGSPVHVDNKYQQTWLTESLITKHNIDMEKEFVKMNRETRLCSKGESRQKKKERMARYDASLLTSAQESTPNQVHGVKRPLMRMDSEETAYKRHCTSPKQLRTQNVTGTVTSVPISAVTTSAGTTNAMHWSPSAVNGINPFIVGLGFPQQLPIVNHVAALPGMFPMYYSPAAQTIPTAPNATHAHLYQPQHPVALQGHPMQCLMYGQPMYGSPFMYSVPRIPYPLQQNLVQSVQYNDTVNPLRLDNSNYEEACKEWLPEKPIQNCRGKKRAETSKLYQIRNNNCGSNALLRSTEPVSNNMVQNMNFKQNNRVQNNEEAVNKTDEESSYSSFYSSFFKSESGSAEDSGDAKNNEREKFRFWDKNLRGDNAMSFQSSNEVTPTYYDSQPAKKIVKRKMDPPWMEQVSVTSELIYQYQVISKNMEEVLQDDKQKMSGLEQPSLVNEQLGQLYSELQLENVAARLTLEERVTSSSSSGEETSSGSLKVPRKREYSKLVMIYEEDAPLPPAQSEPEPVAGTSASF